MVNGNTTLTEEVRNAETISLGNLLQICHFERKHQNKDLRVEDCKSSRSGKCHWVVSSGGV